MKNFWRVISAIGLLAGVIIGAGMFAIPYAISRAGVFWGFFHIVIAFAITICVHMLYGEVALQTEGIHRLPGYAKRYFGSFARHLAFGASVFELYGSLLAYGILGGLFLSQIMSFSSLPPFVWSLVFFAVAGGILLFPIARIGTVNFLLTSLLVLFVVILLYITYSHVEKMQFILADNTYWFLPYGIFLFAMGGASTIPEVADILKKRNRSLLRGVIIISGIIPVVVYGLFAFSVVGISGTGTTEEALAGLVGAVSQRAVSIGSLIGLIAVFTSFLALGANLRNIFRYDYNVPYVLAWAVVISLPLGLFLLGISSFIGTIGLVGAVAIALEGVIILLLALRVCKNDPKCEWGPLSFKKVIPWLLITALIIGAFLELKTII
ncbi:MAG: hypothetical protein COU90_00715 [Candidatus Ryanbacteria bacterium CG10_big_fil_rev_8_21_14_0_10_43_42]|uniref:Amino acid transporter transmembrane domain-containing protein n=1 Tax=Candidatus Ryanbacteria bacterium CG10_big_fil_rev_8_21_14_0_10_43_42 TaxID=1974864 RepID=A0A2M8KXX0_9BACT|nr:MAG: hypothetical protein COU90_00715 [Candidatus Ryanbacteria bacterium CG10_big_fil_rev_8_21_14_0_10_43_42]